MRVFYFLQSTHGIVTDSLVKIESQAIDNRINKIIEKVQKSMNEAQGNIYKIGNKTQEWATDKTKVHESLKEISEKVIIKRNKF